MLVDFRVGVGNQPEVPNTRKLRRLPGVAVRENYLEDCVKQSLVSEDDSAFLSLSSLGQLLKHLAQSFQHYPRRIFPKTHFDPGNPNLIVVRRKDLLPTVLGLYMSGSAVQLPTSQEVLLCDERTTAEEVVIFWHRSLNSPHQGKLFCLASADLLSFDVSREAIDALFRMTQGRAGKRGDAYHLVVVCSAESEEKSYVVSNLDQYRRHAPSCPGKDAVSRYLRDQLTLASKKRFRTPSSATWVPAPTLDQDKCCVRVVRSNRAGEGKSLFVTHMTEELRDIPKNDSRSAIATSSLSSPCYVVVPLHDMTVDVDHILETLMPFVPSPESSLSRIVHFDISSLVKSGLDKFLFDLIALSEIKDARGRVWRRRLTDLYVIEWTENSNVVLTELSLANAVKLPGQQFLNFLPSTHLLSPEDALENSNKSIVKTVNPQTDRQFQDSCFQRVGQYLKHFDFGEDLNEFCFSKAVIEENAPSILRVLVKYCGIPDPSWAELNNFVRFLNCQLRDMERSNFCIQAATGEDLPGFKDFVLKFMIFMSEDFSMPSLELDKRKMASVSDELAEHRLRRHWEQLQHPYVFFNEDRQTMTFVDLEVDLLGRLVVDTPGSDPRVRKQIMSPVLQVALRRQKVFQQRYNEKDQKIKALCRVMGISEVSSEDPTKAFDPDKTYVLTMDNMVKILALQMRIRSGIPVVIMGETGCGKTRLVRYMCGLLAGSSTSRNLIVRKVHGGLTRADVCETVSRAAKVADQNWQSCPGRKLHTILFFDEANSSELLGLIKEVICDRRVNGKVVPQLGRSLHVVAACNPYRKHTEEMIIRLDCAGLGYHVRTEVTHDRFGSTPLRHLVYRVHPLPDSMKSLVWDFGFLNRKSENLYIGQIVDRFINQRETLPNVDGLAEQITSILSSSQEFMQKREDECSFVSLRDVERAMVVMEWFYKQLPVLAPCIERVRREKDINIDFPPLDRTALSVLLALGVCYHARLRERRDYRRHIFPLLQSNPLAVLGGEVRMEQEIYACQEVFVNELDHLPDYIGKNRALCENVFMMIVCIELRIPLFLVGKPGSSKSLAKDVVKTAMRGSESASQLFKALKKVQMISYQCSPMSTAEEIIRTFTKCKQLQKSNDLDSFAACVVLDEVGLAEDSPRLPLKALHPLLDDGTAGTAEPDDDVGKDSCCSVLQSQLVLPLKRRKY